MTYEELQDTFWELAKLLAGSLLTKPADAYIRWKYPEDGQPDWKIRDNVLFMLLQEADDPYGQQVHKSSQTIDGTVYLQRFRTRVWELFFTAYGPASYEVVTALKDGVFTRAAKKLLSEKDIYLVPDMPVCRQAPELFSGKWWPRWDVTLHFNELYKLPPEEAGAIEKVTIGAGGSR